MIQYVWKMIECYCIPILKLLGVFDSVVGCDYEGLCFCSNSGLNLYENEGTNERTATDHWKCLKMKKPLNIVFTDKED